MDPRDLKSVLRTAGIDLWTLIETSIAFAAEEHGAELKLRRDAIVERLYSPAHILCQNCDGKTAVSRSKDCSTSLDNGWASKGKEEEAENHDVEIEDEEKNSPVMEDEQSKILAIKDFLDDPDQSEDFLVRLLQNLADMDITFKALKETDIGRHVNGLRKHSSSEVKRLVKQLVRKWKETVDEWVKVNSANDTSSIAIITDGDSPQLIPAKNHQNGHQTPDFTCSPQSNAQNGSLQPERNGLESVESKARQAPRREPSSSPLNSTSAATSKLEKEKDSLLDPERLASARKRLHENYQEVHNARKQRTIQVMDIHEIPKPKNAFFARNKAGFQAKH